MEIISNRISGIAEIGENARVKLRKLGMRLYHTSAKINYKREFLSRRRTTPAGPYKSFEPISGHKSDTLLNLISENSGPEDTIYDVGAYSGTYALSLTNKHPNRTVVAFEPDRMSRYRLNKNLHETNPDGRVVVRPYGVGDRVGYANLYRSSFRKISSFNKNDATRWGADIIESQVTPITTIDEVSKLFPNPDHVKIDTEGFAPSVLRGSKIISEEHGPTFYIEPHDRSGADRTREIRRWCVDNNYKMEQKKETIICYPEG